MPEIQVSLHGRRIGITSEDDGGGIIINRRGNTQTLLGMYKTATVTSAQVLALFATPQAILGAQGAGLAIIPWRVAIYKPAGTAYAGVAAGADLVLKYTNAAGVQCSCVIETTGFLDQATAQTRICGMPGSIGATPGDYAPAANAAVVLHLLTSEVTTGNSPLYVRMWYDVMPTAYTTN